MHSSCFYSSSVVVVSLFFLVPEGTCRNEDIGIRVLRKGPSVASVELKVAEKSKIFKNFNVGCDLEFGDTKLEVKKEQKSKGFDLVISAYDLTHKERKPLTFFKVSDKGVSRIDFGRTLSNDVSEFTKNRNLNFKTNGFLFNFESLSCNNLNIDARQYGNWQGVVCRNYNIRHWGHLEAGYFIQQEKNSRTNGVDKEVNQTLFEAKKKQYEYFKENGFISSELDFITFMSDYVDVMTGLMDDEQVRSHLSSLNKSEGTNARIVLFGSENLGHVDISDGAVRDYNYKGCSIRENVSYNTKGMSSIVVQGKGALTSIGTASGHVSEISKIDGANIEIHKNLIPGFSGKDSSRPLKLYDPIDMLRTAEFNENDYQRGAGYNTKLINAYTVDNSLHEFFKLTTPTNNNTCWLYAISDTSTWNESGAQKRRNFVNLVREKISSSDDSTVKTLLVDAVNLLTVEQLLSESTVKEGLDNSLIQIIREFNDKQDHGKASWNKFRSELSSYFAEIEDIQQKMFNWIYGNYFVSVRKMLSKMGGNIPETIDSQDLLQLISDQGRLSRNGICVLFLRYFPSAKTSDRYLADCLEEFTRKKLQIFEFYRKYKIVDLFLDYIENSGNMIHVSDGELNSLIALAAYVCNKNIVVLAEEGTDVDPGRIIEYYCSNPEYETCVVSYNGKRGNELWQHFSKLVGCTEGYSFYENKTKSEIDYQAFMQHVKSNKKLPPL